MDCDRTRELLPWLLNDTLEEPERSAIRDHLASCEGCRAEATETRVASRIFAAHLPAAEVVAFAFDEPGELDRDLVASHLASCELCAEELELALESRRLAEADEVEEAGDDTGREARPAAGGAPGSTAPVVPFRRPERGGTAPRRTAAAAWITALAAALIAVVGLGGWFNARQTSSDLADRLAAERRAAEAARGELTELERRSAELAAQQAAARDQIARLEAQIGGGGTAPSAPPEPPPRTLLNVLIADAFPAMVVRSESTDATREIARIAIPPGTEQVVLILNSQGEGRGPFDLAVVDAGGRVIEREAGLERDADGNFNVALPAAALPAGSYRFEIRRPGSATAVESFAVEVRRAR